MTKLCPRGKAAAKRKFKVYPSAYANAYASKVCAGKIKDPSGKKKKDWGPKKANKGAMMKLKNKPNKAGKGMLMPLMGLAGMMKYMQMNKKKSGTVSANKNAVDPVTGKGAGQSQNIQDFGKQAVNIGLKNKMGARNGKLARKPKGAILGALFLANMMKKQGKKEGRMQAAQGEAEMMAAKNFSESGMSKMNKGGYFSGSYIRDDSNVSEINSSTSDYYKGMLD
jgi:hypothetical protein